MIMAYRDRDFPYRDDKDFVYENSPRRHSTIQGEPIRRENPEDRLPVRMKDEAQLQHLRAGNSQRKMVLARLKEGLDGGYIDKAEYERRFKEAEDCYDRAILLGLVGDLPAQPEVEVLGKGTRASDAFKNHCIEWLTKMGGTGRLTTEEQVNRIHHVQRSTTMEDIGRVMADLPAMPKFVDPDLTEQVEEPSIWKRLPKSKKQLGKMLKKVRWSQVNPAFRVFAYVAAVFIGIGLAVINWWLPLLPKAGHIGCLIGGIFIVVISFILWAMDDKVGATVPSEHSN